MVSKEEKKRRKELLAAWEQKEHESWEAKLPASKEDLVSLFEWVDDGWDEEGCDRTLRRTLEFIRLRGLPEEEVVGWLMEHGGGCDCEVLANVASEWIENGLTPPREWQFEGE